MALELLGAALAAYIAAAAIGLSVARWPAAGDLSAAAGVAASLAAVAAAVLWLGGAHGHAALPVSTPIGAFAVRATPLGGLFLLLTGVVGTGVCLYSAAYTAHVGGPLRRATAHALLALVLATIVVVVAAADAVTFLVAWECMVIVSYVLVTVEFDRPHRPQAAFLLLALAKVGFLALVVAFALIGALHPGVSFVALARHPQVSGAAASAAFVLFLVGFGVKAGLLPLQGWLPEAHPAAPAHVSALLSGLVVKTGIYGLVLALVTLLPEPAAWWGYLTLGLGVLTALYGVLFSLLVSDLKRMLAYSTIENLGFMVAMLGAALVFRQSHHPLLAATAVVVVLLHTLYHGLLKSTLFMGAGSVDTATHQLDMDRLGGLARRMRWTTLLFFLGAMGLAGVPPLNGFQTEWLGLQVLIRARILGSPEGRVALAGAGMLLTLTFALAVTTYVRVVGGTFLGAARSEAARSAREVPWAMRLGMVVTAATAVLTALVPPLGVGAAATAAGSATRVRGLLDAVLPPIFLHPGRFPLPVRLGATFLHQVIPGNGVVIVPTSFTDAFISPTYIFCTLAIVIGVTAGVLRLLGRRPRRETAVWAGAIAQPHPAMQYTATAFTNPFRSIFGGIFRAQRAIEGDYDQPPYFVRSLRYARRVVEPVDAYVYRPAVGAARCLSRAAGRLQAGSVSLYLLYVVAVFVIILFIR